MANYTLWLTHKWVAGSEAIDDRGCAHQASTIAREEICTLGLIISYVIVSSHCPTIRFEFSCSCDHRPPPLKKIEQEVVYKARGDEATGARSDTRQRSVKSTINLCLYASSRK